MGASFHPLNSPISPLINAQHRDNVFHGGELRGVARAEGEVSKENGAIEEFERGKTCGGGI